MSRDADAPNWRTAEEVQRGTLREVNETIATLSLRFALNQSAPVQFVCECADPDCADPVNVVLDTYDLVRSEPRRYLIAPNHEDPEQETVIAAGDGYVVVETLAGATSQIAETTDPRRRVRLEVLHRDPEQDERQGAA